MVCARLLVSGANFLVSPDDPKICGGKFFSFFPDQLPLLTKRVTQNV